MLYIYFFVLVIRMEYTGHAHLSLNVITQGFQGLRYDIGKTVNT